MSTWVVDTVTEKPGLIVAELHEVEWFKENPDWQAMMTEYDELLGQGTSQEAVDAEMNRRHPDAPEQFVDALPGEEGADCTESTGRLTLDITNGPELHPMDNVELSVAVLVDVDA